MIKIKWKNKAPPDAQSEGAEAGHEGGREEAPDTRTDGEEKTQQQTQQSTTEAETSQQEPQEAKHYFIDLDRYSIGVRTLIRGLKKLGYDIEPEDLALWEDLVENKEEFKKMSLAEKKEYIKKLIMEKEEPGVYIISSWGGGVYFKLEGVCSYEEAIKLIKEIIEMFKKTYDPSDFIDNIAKNVRMIRRHAKKGVAPPKHFFISIDDYSIDIWSLIYGLGELGYNNEPDEVMTWESLVENEEEQREFIRREREGTLIEYVKELIRRKKEPGVYLLSSWRGGVYYRVDGLCSYEEAKRLVGALSILYAAARVEGHVDEREYEEHVQNALFEILKFVGEALSSSRGEA